MKRLLLIIAFATIAVVSFGQERVKKVLELKNGTKVTGFVMTQDDGSYLLETDGGDVLFYMPDEVNRIFDEGTETSETSLKKGKKVSAQERGLKRAGFGLKFADTGAPLSMNQVSNTFWQDYQKASKRKKWGLWLTIGGGVTSVAGGVMSRFITVHESGSYYNGHGTTTYDYTRSSPVGSIIAGVGLGVTIWGVIKLVGGNKKLGLLATQYNQEHGYASSLSIEAAPSGIALTYKF